MKKISILVPAYNEEKSLPLLYDELVRVVDTMPGYDWEFMFVNDGSTDLTLDILCRLRDRDPRVNYVDLSRNYGKETAMLAGFDHVTGDCMIIMDADLQHPPRMIGRFVEKWEEGYEDVYAIRRDRGRESRLRKWFSLKFYTILQHSTKVKILPNVGDFRLLDRKCIDMLCAMRDAERYTKGMYCWIGCRKTGIEFRQGDRVAGTSKWSFTALLRLAIDGITSFTTAPLRMASLVGMLVSCLAFIYMLYVLVKALIWGDPVTGFPSLMIVMLFIGGIQLLGLGILGEYVGRIFNETKRHPVYFVESFNGEEDRIRR